MFDSQQLDSTQAYSGYSHQTQPQLAVDNTRGFSRIVAFSDGSEQHYQLPKCRNSKQISVFGLGHNGALSAICMAALGHKVIGVDLDQRRINALNQGRTFSEEEGLPELLSQISSFHNLVATDDAFNALKRTDFSLICVNDDTNDDSDASVEKLKALCEQIGLSLRYKEHFHNIVFYQHINADLLKNVLLPILETQSGKKASQAFGVASVQSGKDNERTIKRFYQPTQLTIQFLDKQSCQLTEQLFSGFKTSIRRISW
ncbi:Rossmann-fold NAD(P)-binding domain-containing protein [Paraglaciecola polaris]|uniref:UDP-glucose/GDP-mannose dehydrogenase n=1 Tax=Paraglaciecola polaris LMG 21857 TaxID=1129793 RepID=K6YFM3_9ALTE|nr:UDP-glucose/GDP-mannose dehydrogenase [Paraglaciecola polaris]GAC31534.1 UDP-glucose/GDP-mannose dehydrogenase [Paraglaciecola polaris LMG 21857]|tara:strand:- start:709 stop:1482 length:774 start_codon:yes stop_codon:yes gene_type:complete